MSSGSSKEGGDEIEYGSANNRNVLFNRDGITKGISSGMKENTLLKGLMIHELGHNLGGEHTDGTSNMLLIRTTTTINQINEGSSNGFDFTVPQTSKEFTRIIFDRRDTRNQMQNTIKAGIYTKRN